MRPLAVGPSLFARDGQLSAALPVDRLRDYFSRTTALIRERSCNA